VEKKKIEERNHGKNIMACPITQGGHNKSKNVDMQLEILCEQTLLSIDMPGPLKRSATTVLTGRRLRTEW